MTDSITITDDTYRVNRMRHVTPNMVAYNPSLAGQRFVRVLDQFHRQIQDAVYVDHVYEGRHLELAVRRAKRWMRSRAGRTPVGAPKHIALKMAAFHRVDPEGFDRAMAEAVA